MVTTTSKTPDPLGAAAGPGGEERLRLAPMIIEAPSRLDAHNIVEFVAEVLDRARTTRYLALNGSGVRFVDRVAIDALVDARLTSATGGTELELVAASLAFRATARLHRVDTLLGDSLDWSVAA